MSQEHPMDWGTRIALVPAMGRFVEDLPVLGVARFGPLPMDGWTPTDHALARMWAVCEAHGDEKPPPARVADYLRELRESCGAAALDELRGEG